MSDRCLELVMSKSELLISLYIFPNLFFSPHSSWHAGDFSIFQFLQANNIRVNHDTSFCPHSRFNLSEVLLTLPSKHIQHQTFLMSSLLATLVQVPSFLPWVLRIASLWSSYFSILCPFTLAFNPVTRMLGLSHIIALLYFEISSNHLLTHNKGQSLYSSLQSLRWIAQTPDDLSGFVSYYSPHFKFCSTHTGLLPCIKYSGNCLPPDFCTSHFLCLECYFSK